MKEFEKPAIEQKENKERLTLPQELINRLWRARHPDFRGSEDLGAILDEVFFALAEARGLSRANFEAHKGVWGTHRYYQDANRSSYVDLGIDIDKLSDDYRSNVVEIPIRTNSLATGKADFWNETYTFFADQTMINEQTKKLEEKWKQIEEEENRLFEKRHADTIALAHRIGESANWLPANDARILDYMNTYYPDIDVSGHFVRIVPANDANTFQFMLAEGTDSNKSILDIAEFRK